MKDSRREVLRILRIVGIGLLTGGAIVFAVLALRDEPPTVPVWVNREAIQAGQPLSAGKPHLVMIPPGIQPEGSLTEVNSLLEVPVTRYLPKHSVLTEADLLGSEQTRSIEPGQVLLHLRVAPVIGENVQAEEIIDIWGRDSNCDSLDCPPQVLATAGRVVQVSEAQTGSWEAEKPVTVAVIVRQTETGPILMSEANGSLNFVLRSASTSPTKMPTVKMEGEKQS